MADAKIENLTAISEQKTTDLYEVSDDGNGSYKETRAQQVAYFLQLFAPNFTAENTVYVDPDGSNDDPGNQNEPFADPFYASTAITGTTTNRKLINIQAGEYETTSFTLKPNQTFSGSGLCTQLDVNNTITLDSSWSSAGIGSFTEIKDLFFENTFDLDFSTYGAGKGVIYNNSILGNITVTGASGNVPQANFNNCDLGDCTIESASSDFYNCQWSGSDEDIVIQSSGAGGNSSCDISNCLMGSGTDVLISGASGSTTSARIFASPIRGTLTLDSTFTTLSIDAVSMPSSGVTLTNGALISQITPVGNAPFKSLNNAYTAQNYIVPVAQNSSSNSTAWNLNVAPSAKQTMTENTTLANPTNQIEGSFYCFVFTQDSTPRTLAFGTDYDFGGVTPVISTASGTKNIFVFYSDGTSMKCIGSTLGV
jgi:hypothetical protein